MTLEPDFDSRVRQALDPDAGVVDRMVLAALQQGRIPGRRRLRSWRLALAAAAVLVCALWIARHRLAPPAPPDDFVLTRAGNVIMIESRSGQTWILGPDVIPNPAKAGTGLIIVEEDSK